MSGIPGKIVLKSTTKISLTDRFAGIRQNASVYEQNAQKVKALRPTAPIVNGTGFRGPLDAEGARERMRQETLAAQRAAREDAIAAQREAAWQETLQRVPAWQENLAAQRAQRQAASRPTVMAAQRLKQRSIYHRLGTPNRVSASPAPNRGDVRDRLSFPTGGGAWGGRNGFTNGFGSGGGGYMPPRNFGLRRGRGRGRGFRGRGARGFSVGLRSRGGFRSGRGGGLRGGFRRGGFRRGRGGFRGNRRPRVSKETLDEQLDQYMSKSKATLDSELDAYMAGSDD